MNYEAIVEKQDRVKVKFIRLAHQHKRMKRGRAKNRVELELQGLQQDFRELEIQKRAAFAPVIRNATPRVTFVDVNSDYQ